MSPSLEQAILIEQRIANESKSEAVAYLLLSVFSFLGLHRFYLGQTRAGIGLLFITGVTVLPVICHVLIAFAFLRLSFTHMILIDLFCLPLFFLVTVWLLLDIFHIPGFVREHRQALRQRYTDYCL